MLVGRLCFLNGSVTDEDVSKQWSVLRKCMNKFDCLVHEMQLIKELTPSLNVQSDSI